MNKQECTVNTPGGVCFALVFPKKIQEVFVNARRIYYGKKGNWSQHFIKT